MKPHAITNSLLILIAAIQFAVYTLKYASGETFWDLNVYQIAIEKQISGLNAYEISDGNLFVYHPLVLHIFSLVSQKPKEIFLTIYFLIASYFFLLLSIDKKLMAAFFIGFSFLGFGVVSFETGNLTIFLHLALLSLIINGINSKRQTILFSAGVALCTFIKPYMVVYLAIVPALYLYRGEKIKPYIKLSLLTLIACVTTLVLHSLFFNDLFVEFYKALHTQTIDRGDIGISAYSYFNKKLNAPAIAFLLHLLVVATAGFFTLLYFFRTPTKNDLAFILSIYFALTLLNPRLKEYDIAALLFALFSSCLLISTNLRDRILLLIVSALPLINLQAKNGFFASKSSILGLSISILILFFILKTYQHYKTVKLA